MDNQTKLPAPIDVSGDSMSIHLSYIRRDIDEIKVNQTKNNEDIKSQFRELKDGYVTRFDFEEHVKIDMKTDDDFEKRIRILEESRWKIAGATGIIVGVLTILADYAIKILVK